MINYRYLSHALRQVGHESTTVATHDYAIYGAGTFDIYLVDYVKTWFLPQAISARLTPYLAFADLLRRFDVAHFSFSGGALSVTPLAGLEPWLLRLSGVRTVVFPYGADFFRYQWIAESLVRHAMLISYPAAGRDHAAVDRRVERWTRHADVVLSGMMVEGASRWDVIVPNFLVLPDDRLPARVRWSRSNGRNAVVRIVHAPNHRGIKGTEFIVEAVERLRARGYLVELVLLEKMLNQEVLRIMQDAEICIEHCIGSGFGLFTIEAMSMGAAVVGNLEDEHRIGVHRHFGWLSQCPVVSSRIDEVEATLEALIVNPDLREELGRIGVEYVARFHSSGTAQHLFNAIYARLGGADVDLMRLFHPLASDYMRGFAPLKPPLVRNRLRSSGFGA